MNGYTCASLLKNLPDDELHALAATHLKRSKNRTRYSLANSLIRRFTSNGYINAQWKALKPEEQALLGILLRLGGFSTRSRLQKAVIALQVAEVREGELRVGGRSFDEILDALTKSGLVLPYKHFWTEFIPAADQGGIFIVPAEAFRQLSQERGKASISWIWHEPAFDRIQPADPLAFLRDLVFFWGTAWQAPLRLLKSGALSKRTKTGLLSALERRRWENGDNEADPAIYLELLRGLLVDLGLLSEVEQNLQAEIPRSGRIPKLWTKSPYDIIKKVWKNLPGSIADFPFPKQAEAVATAYGVDEIPVWARNFVILLSKKMRSRPDQAVSLGALWMWLLDAVGARIPVPPDVEYSYPRAIYDGEAEFRVALQWAHILHWIGILDLLWQGDRMVGVRLSDVGKALLLNHKWNPPHATTQIIVQPSFQILAMGPVSLEALALLDLIAKRQKVEHLVAEYKLERLTFLHSLQGGVDGRYALERLQALAPSGIPQNIHRSIEEWIAEFERITVYYGGVLVEAASPQLLKRVLNRAPFKGDVIVLNETLLLVPANSIDDLRHLMLDYGIWPLEVADPQKELEGGVDISSSGQIQPRMKFPGIYLRGTLRRLAEPERDGSWQLTPESVRQAARVMGVQKLVGLLESLNGHPLPKPLFRQIYLWSEYFGHVQVQRVLLLRFRDAEAVRLIRTFPGLSRKIRPFAPAPNSGLAVVQEQDLPKVLERLRELNIPVDTVDT